MSLDKTRSIDAPLVRIIHLEDDPHDQELVAEMLAAHGIRCSLVVTSDREGFRLALQNEAADLIISDFSLPGYDGVRALELARQLRREVPFIFFSGTLGEDAAIDSLKNGATDYVLKQRPERLMIAVRRALTDVAEKESRKRVEAELRKRDVLLRKIVEGVEDLVAVIDLEGRLQLVSRSYEQIFGAQTVTVGADFLEGTLPADRLRVWEVFRRTIETGHRQRVEYRLSVPGEGVRIIEAQGSVMADELGKTEFVLWVSRDITERRVSEERIHEQATLLDEARDAICVTDLDQNILYWNRSAERLYGWSRAEALGKNANEMLSQGKVALTALKTLIQRGEWRGELHQTTRNKTHVIVESRWTLIRDAGKAPKSILVINTDITQRKAAEDKIREQAALLDKARDAIVVSDLERRIVYWNEGATRLYGWQPKEAIGKLFDHLLFREIPETWPAMHRRLHDTGEWLGELRQVTREGNEVIVQCRQTLVRDAQDQPVSVLSIQSDITEQKRIEEQFLRTQRMESLGALAGGIAHDLNNLLAPIMMAVEVIQNDPTNEANRGLLELMGSSARRGSELVKQILSFARGADGRKAILQAERIVSEVMQLARDTFPPTIKVKSSIPSPLPKIHGDATQVHQVVLNLCVNARDAMPNGGVLKVEMDAVMLSDHMVAAQPWVQSGQFVVLRVKDTGTGIPPEALPKIFEPFFTTKEHGRGTGLGLSTVAGIVRGHGGFVEVSSELGQGTTFQVFFPVVEEFASIDGDAEPSKPVQGNNECVLVVDDESAILEITRATLLAFNYRVHTAGSGTEAIAVFLRHESEIDLVLTDMVMPTLDGMALARALRQIDPLVRLIGVSGLPTEMAAPESAGIKTFLRKPFSTVALLQAIRSVLDE